MRNLLTAAVLFLLIFAVIEVGAEDLTADQIIKKVDDMLYSKTSRSTAKQIITTPGGEVREYVIEGVTMDGQDKTLSIYLRPAKVKGVPTMDAMVWNVPPGEKRIAPLLDARKGKVYSCIYENSGGRVRRITEYLLVTIDELLEGLEGEVVFFGDAVIKCRAKIDAHPLAAYDQTIDWYPRAADIGRIGFQRSRSGTDDPENMEPLYLHSKECNITYKER